MHLDVSFHVELVLRIEHLRDAMLSLFLLFHAVAYTGGLEVLLLYIYWCTRMIRFVITDAMMI